MQPEQAAFLLNILLPQIENEQKTTRRVIAAIPAGKGDYRPDPKARNAMELAWHIATVDCWFLDSIAKGDFVYSGEQPMPNTFKAGDDIAKWYDENFTQCAARVRSLTSEQLARDAMFFDMNLPLVMYLGLSNSHSIHHRGQLATYLRPMGSKVPRIYGESADEPMEMPARA